MEYYETLTTYQFKRVKVEYTHTQALLKMLNAKNTKHGSEHDVTMGKYSNL